MEIERVVFHLDIVDTAGQVRHSYWILRLAW